MLKLIKTNNFFGQHDFIIENVSNVDETMAKLAEIKWTKKPVIINDSKNITVHCFTNYDKVKIEGAFSNG